MIMNWKDNDIGMPDDYARAVEEFELNKNRLLPETL
jgi:hypothetical protein